MTIIDQATQGTESPVASRVPMVAAGLLAAGFVLWIVSLFTINIADVNGLGFAGAFTPVTWLSLLLISGGTVVTVLRVPLEGGWFWRLAIAGLLLVPAERRGFQVHRYGAQLGQLISSTLLKWEQRSTTTGVAPLSTIPDLPPGQH